MKLPVLLCVLSIVIGACAACREAPAPVERPTLFVTPVTSQGQGTPPSTVVATVELAADDESRARGLMLRESLAEDRGMLFIYPRERVRSFWMQDTKIPLSIAFANSTGLIVRILDMEPHFGRPGTPPTYSSERPAVYALEMDRGWFRERGIREGDRMTFHPEIAATRPE